MILRTYDTRTSASAKRHPGNRHESIVTTGFGTGNMAAANDVVVQANGRIVVAGGNGPSFALARYLAK